MEADPNWDRTRRTKSTDFWIYIDRLVANHPVVVDRPKISPHPRYPDITYPLDYGYLDGTTGADGDGIDVWIGSKGIQPPSAIVLTCDLIKKDIEIKLMLGCTREEIQTIMDFHNGHTMQANLVLRERDELDLLRSRHSIRRFTDRPIPEDLLRHVLEAATWAPSAHNRQPWRFVVLSSQESKSHLAEKMGEDFEKDLRQDGLGDDEIQAQVKRSRDRITQAPICLVLCLDSTKGDSYPDPRRIQAEHLMGVQSVAMAGQNLMLAAGKFGLGSVWMCAPLFAQETVQKALNLPSTWQPQGMILLGYPAKQPVSRPRRSVDQIALFL